MDTRKIGSLHASVAGLGCNNLGWRIDEASSRMVVDAALDAGINFFDTADIYGEGRSEEFLGRALGARRKQVLIATKFGHSKGAGAGYIPKAAEDSLRRLGTDYIDLYQIHKPDPNTPIAETLGALNDLVRAGKVHEIGCSNFTAGQLREAAAAARPGQAKFVSVQNEYSLMQRGPETDVLPECIRLQLAFIPYFPLASGLLTGKYREGRTAPPGSRGDARWGPQVFTEQNVAIVERLIAFAEAHGHTVLELAMSWLASRPAVASVIAGATSPGQVRENARAVNWKLSEKDLVEVDLLLAGRGSPAAT